MVRFFSKHILLIVLSCGALAAGLFLFWVATLTIPNIQSFEERRVGVSTKIYDRTGTVVLYDLNQNTRRTVVKDEEISDYIKQATVAIEDAGFYSHYGIDFSSIIRAVIVNILNGRFDQGGSTITQQVVKNSLLTTDKKLSRKFKEWILAINLERIMSKTQILNLYLNESPYGGNIYGVEEAAQTFFGKSAKNVTLAEAAYLAALPQAPSYYSPYGNHRSDLDARKNLVLSKMLEHKLISQNIHDQAKNEKVTFLPSKFASIKAPHFVMYVKEYLEKTYGVDSLEQRGFKVITTLDYELQKKAEEMTRRIALTNSKNYNASNAALVALDPKTGDILTMVGSRDYFDKEIDGNFNVTTARRQPGSAFKPFVYATAFNKGYLPETVVFDLRTEFSTNCSPQGLPLTNTASCYHPENYDLLYPGPISLRNALAQSRNIPAIKTLYLAGLTDSLRLAKDMGITTLTNTDNYGLTLVLGGGEVSPLDITSAYSVFANNGIKNKPVSILKITDKGGVIIEEAKRSPTRVLDENVSLMINDVLSDDTARTPAFGAHSKLYIAGYDVAVKTGTTNDYRDAWIVGYSPTLAVGAWAGNNDNSPMEKKVAGFIIAPLWNEFITEALTSFPNEKFSKPEYPDTTNLKPILRGEYDPTNPHEILYYIDKDNPLGPSPLRPENDPQFNLWELPVQIWAGRATTTTPLFQNN